MFTVKPVFFNDFTCKADKCTDTCCAGWEIDIDSETVCKYMSVNGDFNNRLSKGISLIDEVYSFRLKENERCWFLADNGLCDIYSNLGKDFLCEICKEHPRFYNCYDNAEEIGLGLCCEKTCELLFADDSPFSVIVDGEMSDDDYSALCLLRNRCFEIVCNRNNPFSDNIKDLLLLSAQIQSEYFNEEFELNGLFSKADIFRQIVKIYSETEAINSEWETLLGEINADIDKLAEISDNVNFDAISYEKMISYIMYRHLIESAFAGNFIGGICFSVVSVVFIHILDCLCVLKYSEFTSEDRINNVKLWSKQTEYSEENTEMLKEESIALFFN